VRKITSSGDPPSHAYLIVQEEAARRLSGHPRENQFSLLVKPFFKFRILDTLNRRDFSPAPKVDAALLEITRRQTPLIQRQDVETYRAFIGYAFDRSRRSIRSALRGALSYRSIKRLSGQLGFAANATVTQLTLEQWLGLFREFRS
jgi:23S rRNA (adenine-N6)-dimethyltransferase